MAASISCNEQRPAVMDGSNGDVNGWRNCSSSINIYSGAGHDNEISSFHQAADDSSLPGKGAEPVDSSFIVTKTAAMKAAEVAESETQRNSALRLHISNIPFKFRNHDLLNLVQAHGKVVDAEIIFNDKGSKGFGFVTVASVEDAENVKKNLRGKIVEGRTIEVNNATTRSVRRRSENNCGSRNYSSTVTVPFGQTLSPMSLSALNILPGSPNLATNSMTTVASLPTQLTAQLNMVNNFAGSQYSSNVENGFDPSGLNAACILNRLQYQQSLANCNMLRLQQQLGLLFPQQTQLGASAQPTNMPSQPRLELSPTVLGYAPLLSAGILPTVESIADPSVFQASITPSYPKVLTLGSIMNSAALMAQGNTAELNLQTAPSFGNYLPQTLQTGSAVLRTASGGRNRYSPY